MGARTNIVARCRGGYNTLTRDVRRLVDIPSLFGFSGENGRAITLMKACKKALEFFGEEYIFSILDVKRGYVIMPISKEWGVPCNSPCIVDKSSGAVDAFFPPDHQEEIKTGRYLKIPHKYALPKIKQ